jgi:hypothetical protein
MSEPATRLPRGETPVSRATPRRRRTGVRVTLAILGGLVVLIVIGFLSLNLFEDKIRGYLEQQLNTKVQGYDFRLGGLDLYPLSLSLDFENLVVMQEEHPDPPIADIPKWRAGLQWSQLLRGRVVSDHHIERPVFHLSRSQAKEEAQSERRVEVGGKSVPEHKWQEMVTTMYPVTINEFKVESAEVNYVDTPGKPPLRLTDLNIRLGNIQNVKSKPNEYPSSIHVDTRFGKAGRIEVDGKADFLAEPIAALHADITLDGVELDQLRSIAAPYHVQLRAGTLKARAHAEVSPTIRLVQIHQVALDGARVDYIYQAKGKEPAKKVAEKAVEAEKKESSPAAGPQTVVKVAEAKISNSEFGVVNKAAEPEYRVFLTDTDAELKNLSNRPRDGIGVVKLTGKFMGSGETQVDGAFRPETKLPDFDLNLRIENADMPAMNDMLRAHGKFDVTEGRFSMFSELTVRDGGVEGYVKPLFRDMKIYDAKQDSKKPVLKKLYEGVIGGVSNLLENKRTDAVATKAEISGRLDEPNTHTWEAVAQVLRNAFLRAIVPGLDRDVGQDADQRKHG